MKKFITANVVAIISLLGTIIIGLSSIAWSNEKENIYKDINSVKTITHIQDSLIWNEFADHEKKHVQGEVLRKERERKDREYFDVQFEGLEKLIMTIKD